MTVGKDIVAWLRTQLDADERAAQQFDPLELVARNGIESTAGSGVLDWLDRFGSAWVLRDVEAKRRILDEYEGLTDVVRLLALPYENRSGYRGDWGPGR